VGKDADYGMMKAIGAALGIALLLKAFAFDFMIVEGVSMEPALQSGEIVVINRLAYGIVSPFPAKNGNRRYAVCWKTPQEGDIIVFWTPFGNLAVKRVSSLSVQEDSFIALGDNALQSYDSRSYGPVPFTGIVGKVAGKK
jgi:signal peptidase I